ncbi:MAG: putative glycoside hydrolase [Elusimicrobiota bacterium]
MLATLLLLALTACPAFPQEMAPASTATLRGVHFTGWAAGSPKARRRFVGEMKAAGFNAVVIALKDSDGREFVRDVPFAVKTGAFLNAIPDLPGAVRDFKEAGIYTIARIAAFKDDHLAHARPDLAVHFPDGRVWTDDRGMTWADPYRHEVWEYVIDVASRAAAAGFDEIQFDYIRFPSDGKTRQCRYSRKDHSTATSSAALGEFLALASSRLRPLGVKISIATFGLTTSVDNGMGIGQTLESMASVMDYVSPMLYPSHYRKGVYGLSNPNRYPYATVHNAISDALSRLGGSPSRLRPYLQDFSMGVRYTPELVRSQIRAAEELGVSGWILWNPGNHYDWSAAQAGPIEKPVVERAPAAAPAVKSKKRRKAVSTPAVDVSSAGATPPAAEPPAAAQPSVAVPPTAAVPAAPAAPVAAPAAAPPTQEAH